MDTSTAETISEVIEVVETFDYTEILSQIAVYTQDMQTLLLYIHGFLLFIVVVILCYFCYKFFRIFI